MEIFKFILLTYVSLMVVHGIILGLGQMDNRKVTILCITWPLVWVTAIVVFLYYMTKFFFESIRFERALRKFNKTFQDGKR